MHIIFEDLIINTDHYGSIYMDEDGLEFDTGTVCHTVHGVPSDALQQIAVAIATDKKFIELGGHQ